MNKTPQHLIGKSSIILGLIVKGSHSNKIYKKI